MTTKDDKVMRSFDTGATRDTAEGKLDYDGFLNPAVLRQFARYMNMNRLQSDGQLRDSDNWQKGIPMDAYRKSLHRHHMEFWPMARNVEHHDRDGEVSMVGVACGMLFNIMGYLTEWLKEHDEVRFDDDEPTTEMKERQDKVKREEVGIDIPEGYCLSQPIMSVTAYPPIKEIRILGDCLGCMSQSKMWNEFPCDNCKRNGVDVRGEGPFDYDYYCPREAHKSE